MGHDCCCVVNCKNTGWNNSDVKYYKFPTAQHKLVQRKKWIAAVKRVNSDGSAWIPKVSDKICSEHFVQNAKSDNQLSPSYVPTIFPSVYKKTVVVNQTTAVNRHQRFMQRRSLEQNLTRHVQEGKSEKIVKKVANSITSSDPSLFSTIMSQETPNVELKNKKKKCCVKDCKSGALSDQNIHYHVLPKKADGFVMHTNYFGKIEKLDRLKAWQIALGIGDNCSKNLLVCSLHFKTDDYFFSYRQSDKKYLKKTAVPSLNIPKALNGKKVIERSSRLLKQAHNPSNVGVNTEVLNDEVEASSELATNMMDQEDIVVTDYLDVVMDSPSNVDQSPEVDLILKKDVACSFTPDYKEAAVETNKFSVISFINSDSELSTMTGLQSFALLDTIAEILLKCYGTTQFEKSSLDVRGKLILTYMKLKQNLSYSALAILFQCSANHCQKIFEKTISMLSKTLRNFIEWPSRMTISRNLPLCFKGYEDVRVVLDCTEIYFHHSKCLDCQMKTFSQGKGSLTAKFMTGVSPSGSIIYVSRMYGETASDTAIFNQSDLVNLLEKGDAIMVDEGFLIDGICEKNGWKLYRPSYSKDKQLSKNDVDQSCDVSRARVNIEKCDQKLKSFHVLSSSVPCELFSMLEDIFTVICGTINLSSPIVVDSNFMQSDIRAHNLYVR